MAESEIFFQGEPSLSVNINPKNNLSYLYYSPQKQQPSLSVNIFDIGKLLILNKIRNFLKN